MLVLPDTLTHAQARATLGLLRQTLQAEGGTAVVADVGALRHFDSSALAVLLACRRESIALGKTFSVRGMAPRLRELATVYGVSGLLAEG